MEQRELVIIGAGPAGLTAAVYGKRSGLDVLVLEKGKPGGQILITSEIENWPGAITASAWPWPTVSGRMPSTSRQSSAGPR